MVCPDFAVALSPSTRSYKGRHVVECNINRFKDFRALATRYEKRGHQFLAALHVACIILWL